MVTWVCGIDANPGHNLNTKKAVRVFDALTAGEQSMMLPS